MNFTITRNLFPWLVIYFYLILFCSQADGQQAQVVRDLRSLHDTYYLNFDVIRQHGSPQNIPDIYNSDTLPEFTITTSSPKLHYTTTVWSKNTPLSPPETMKFLHTPPLVLQDGVNKISTTTQTEITCTPEEEPVFQVALCNNPSEIATQTQASQTILTFPPSAYVVKQTCRDVIQHQSKRLKL